MEKFDEYLDKAKDLAEDASEIAKKAAGEVASKARELADDHSKAKELMKEAKEQSVEFAHEAKEKSSAFASGAREKSSTIAAGAKEKVQGILQDSNAVKEIGQGITDLENLPAFDGSIIYNMDLEAMLSDLRALQLIIKDNRLDDKSVEEEIRKVMDKVRPSEAKLADGEAAQLTDEERAIETARTTAYNACKRALATLGIAE